MECSFPNLRLARSCALSLSSDPCYVLHFAIQSSSTDAASNDDRNVGLFAAAISGSNEIKLYSKETFCLHRSLLGHTERISGIKFDIKHPSVIWSTSLDGTLRYWNFEEKNVDSVIVAKCEDGVTSFDISCDGSLLVFGTEKKIEEIVEPTQTPKETTVKLQICVGGQSSAQVDFGYDAGELDIRNVLEKTPKCLATFDSCHSDDITKVVFHPSNPKVFVTGSTDGLVSVLDLTTYEEEDALLQTLNTESSVSTLGYFGPSHEFLYVLTHVETLQIWKYVEGELLSSMTDMRDKVDKATPIDYVIDCIYHESSKRMFIVAGTHRGSIEILHMNLDVVEPFQTLTGGHSATVRCLAYQNNSLFSGAEDGMVCSWMECSEDQKKLVYSKIYWNILLSLLSTGRLNQRENKISSYLNDLRKTNWIIRNTDLVQITL